MRRARPDAGPRTKQVAEQPTDRLNPEQALTTAETRFRLQSVQWMVPGWDGGCAGRRDTLPAVLRQASNERPRHELSLLQLHLNSAV